MKSSCFALSRLGCFIIKEDYLHLCDAERVLNVIYPNSLFAISSVQRVKHNVFPSD